MRPDVASVDAPEPPVDFAGFLKVALKRTEDPVPDPLARPSPEAGCDCGPGAVPLRQIAPRAAGGETIQHPVEDEPVVLARRAGRAPRREQQDEAAPLRVRECVTE